MTIVDHDCQRADEPQQRNGTQRIFHVLPAHCSSRRRGYNKMNNDTSKCFFPNLRKIPTRTRKGLGQIQEGMGRKGRGQGDERRSERVWQRRRANLGSIGIRTLRHRTRGHESKQLWLRVLLSQGFEQAFLSQKWVLLSKTPSFAYAISPFSRFGIELLTLDTKVRVYFFGTKYSQPGIDDIIEKTNITSSNLLANSRRSWHSCRWR